MSVAHSPWSVVTAGQRTTDNGRRTTDSGMKIHEQLQGAVTVLRPEGPLIEGDAAVLKQRLLQTLAASLGRFVVDMSTIPYVDSKGLESLVEVTEEMGRSGQ